MKDCRTLRLHLQEGLVPQNQVWHLFPHELSIRSSNRYTPYNHAEVELPSIDTRFGSCIIEINNR